MKTEDFNAFVVGCHDIAVNEAWRLRRLGVPLDIDDAVQIAMVGLLERRRHAPTIRDEDAAKWARTIIGHELINKIIVNANAKKRGGCGQFNKTREAERAKHVDVYRAEIAVDSHEDDVIAAIDAERIVARFGMPEDSSGPRTRLGRQVAWQRNRRWKERVMRALNDNTDQTKKSTSSDAFIVKEAA